MRLAATLYLPAGDGPFATLLEALPYRKDDITSSYADSYVRYVERGRVRRAAPRPARHRHLGRHPRRRVHRHRARRPAHRHRVDRRAAVVTGKRRHVRHLVLGLQLAAHGDGGRAELGAVVAMYATDDRYTDDVHYCGGVLRALDLIDYPLYMVAMNALPPVPAVWADGDETTGPTSGCAASSRRRRGC